jgi:hypothetical protein
MAVESNKMGRALVAAFRNSSTEAAISALDDGRAEPTIEIVLAELPRIRSTVMTRKFISLLAATAAIAGVATIFPATADAEGTLMVDGKNYPLTHAVAYPATIYGEEGIAVVLSAQAVSNATLKEVMAGEKNDRGPEFKRPYLKLQFTKAGELALWRAAAGDTSLVGGRDLVKGELKMQDGRVNGTANKPNDVGGKVHSAFDVRFDVALLGAAQTAPAPSTMKPGPDQTADSKKDKPATEKPTTESIEKLPPKPAEDQFNVKDLPLTKDATDLDYQTPVKQVFFKTRLNVNSAFAELGANLQTQGWAIDGTDMVSAQSVILRRKRGNAAIKIFIRREKDGSKVQIFTEGLSWDGK